MNDDLVFQEAVWEYYRRHGRASLPWRLPEANGTFDPYKILVSELMLQQTQVPRVIPKYAEFLAAFPSVQELANAELGDVLRVWSGLGYNRRAKFLHQAAQFIEHDLGGEFPQTDLTRLPGVGVNTAGAVAAYAFNEPTVFLETNIRTVYIHHYFNDGEAISDAELQPIVTRTLDQEHPREWYWALMDYGSFLKQTVGNRSRQSKTYAKQSAFAGSRRQVRGAVIRLLGEQPMTSEALAQQLGDDRLSSVLDDLTHEGLINKQGAYYSL